MQTHMAHKFTKFTLQDVTDQLGLVSLQGPKSQEILVSLGLEAEDQKKVQQLAFARCEEIALRTIHGNPLNAITLDHLCLSLCLLVNLSVIFFVQIQ